MENTVEIKDEFQEYLNIGYYMNRNLEIFIILIHLPFELKNIAFPEENTNKRIMNIFYLINSIIS